MSFKKYKMGKLLKIILGVVFLAIGANYFFNWISIEFFNGIPFMNYIAIGLIILGLILVWLGFRRRRKLCPCGSGESPVGRCRRCGTIQCLDCIGTGGICKKCGTKIK